VYRKTDEGYEFLLGKHSGYHKWVLPKGLVEKGESQMEAAVREVEEEVGVQARIVEVSPLKTIEYYYFADMGDIINKNPHTEDTTRRVKTYQEEGGAKTRVHKQVFFYLMEMEHDLGSAGWEMEDRQWVNYDEGRKTLAFESEQEVFAEAGKALGI
jgi:8-oxo-dGTP pyrophosphatase MutT (NUDIX family)